MRLYFVRHGKTEWNVEGRFQGAGGDSPLLEESKQDLKELGHYLADTDFDCVFSSDLTRARKTAQLIMEENHFPKQLIYTEALREWQLGNLEGQKIDIMSSIYPKQMDAFRNNLALFKGNQFNAETVYQTTKRVLDLVQCLKNKPFEKVLFVGHGANLTASIKTLLGFPPAQLRLDGGLTNASLTIVETEDFKHFNLITWNDTSYLDVPEDQVVYIR
ncbi:histidine phosphatase family protein [Streptococcus saliviloxodontae]|uniref:Phosphoglycerate mutase n=1 Tax=Streptococcus saliviloxodontae TaxID=1349416 RepID=A0ABS2PMN4_9STRE|nr:histidine phosphatase family protein [Streptococcus saliviloxodontae]MBM7636361.1 putative phosphoglycerate mutase [Streptococcus saliviloxodontae]